VGEYRSLGYTPMGVLNYLVRFGWAHGDEEIFSKEELIAKFDFASVGRADGKFDAKKFADVAFEHLKRPELTPVRKYAKMVRPFLAQIGIESPDESILVRAIPTVRERGRTLADAAQAMAFFFRPPEVDEKAAKKFLTPDTAPKLAALVEQLSPLATWDETAIESTVNAWLASKHLTIKDVAQPARVAITGKTVSPGLFEMLVVLGKEESLRRLQRGIEFGTSSAP
jgi:glutamyl-tRNA synthetase